MQQQVDHLIECWQQGEQQAAEQIYDAYRNDLFRLAYTLLANRADAEEVVQDALANIKRYNPQKANFRTWLHTIAVSRCRDKRRRKRFNILSLATWRRQGGDVAIVMNFRRAVLASAYQPVTISG